MGVAIIRGIVDEMLRIDGEPVEWMMIAVLPNYCFFHSLPDLVMKHQYYSRICTTINDIAALCELTRSRDTDHICCSGKLQQDPYSKPGRATDVLLLPF